jgi:hypothetical protein
MVELGRPIAVPQTAVGLKEDLGLGHHFGWKAIAGCRGETGQTAEEGCGQEFKPLGGSYDIVVRGYQDGARGSRDSPIPGAGEAGNRLLEPADGRKLFYQWRGSAGLRMIVDHDNLDSTSGSLGQQ